MSYKQGFPSTSMLLKEYLKKYKKRIEDFAPEVGISASLLAKISAGTRQCTCRSALLIEKATNGEVSRFEAQWPECYIKRIHNAEQMTFVPTKT